MNLASPLRVAFAGTSQFAVPPLQALLGSRHTVVGVLTQPDRPQGRGRQLLSGPVKTLALSAGLAICQPAILRTADAFDALTALAPDLMVVVAYGQILPPALLRLPRLGCINLHASLLPRWRGAAPIQRAILAGDAVTGVTIMQMDEGLDTGDILAARSVPIGAHDTSASLHAALARLGAQVLLGVLEAKSAGTVQAHAQPATGVTYAAKIAKAEGRIDWNAAATVIAAQVRAFDPWPVADTVFAGEPLRIHAGFAGDGVVAPTVAPGTWLGIAGDALRVACGVGELHVTRLQRTGRRIIAAREFVNSTGTATGRFT